MSSAGRVAVVTGAGSGIGRAVSLALLGAGYRVALAGRREDALNEAVGASPAGPESAIAIPTDVTDTDDVRELFARVIHAIAYTASKHAVTGLTKSISLEGRPYDIACGQIDIGNAATALTATIGQGALQPDGSRAAEPLMDVRHVADAVLYMAALSLDANVEFLTVMATNMPYIGRG